MQVMWLKIDVGLPRVLRRRTAFPTLRAPDGLHRGCVKYPDARVEDYPRPYGTVCDGRPPVLLELCEKYHGHDLQFFPRNVENNRNGWRNVCLSVGSAIRKMTCYSRFGKSCPTCFVVVRKSR
jgi:hypothetical protein